MKFIKFFTAFVILVLFTMFATANTHTVPIYAFLKGQSLIGYIQQGTDAINITHIPKELPIFLIVFIFFGLGFIVAWFMNISINRKHKKSVKKLRRQIKEQDMELQKLRKLPATDVAEIGSDQSHLPIQQKDIKNND